MEFIKRNLLQITLLALVGVYLYTRLPFFLKYLVPGFHFDTFLYYYAAWLMDNGMFEQIRNLPVDIPMGYPFFLAFLFKAPNIWIIVFQSLFQLFSSLFLIHTSFKHYGSKALFLGVLIMAYFFDSTLLSHETFLYTESIFISTIFLFIAIFINAVNNFKPLHLIQMFITVTLLVLIRANGIVFVLGPLFVFLANHKNRGIFKLILTGYVLQFLILSFLNLGLKGYFFPIELNRYKKVIASTLKNSNDTEKESINSKEKSGTPKGTLLLENLSEWSTEKASFYYSIVPVLIDEFETRKNFYAIHPYFTIEEECKGPILKDLEEYRVDHIKKPDLVQKNYLYVIHLFSKAHIIFIKNNLILALFTLPAFFFLFLIFRKGPLTKELILYLASVFFYFFNILFSTLGHNRFQPRYINTFDVFVYFGLFMLFVLAMNHFQGKKSPEGTKG